MSLAIWARSFALTMAVCSPAFGRENAPIEGHCALRIGKYTVTQYLLTKYYSRFEDSIRHETGLPPNSDAVSHWITTFVDQQCVIALAQHRGYGNRAEVKNSVARMEHYMLTQENGPYYDYIVAHSDISRDHAETYSDAYQYNFELAVIAGKDRQALCKAVNADPSKMSAAEVKRAAEQCRSNASIDVAIGRGSWPFYPFPEIRDIVCAMQAGDCQVVNLPNFGTYLIGILAKTPSANPVKSAPPDFSSLARAAARAAAIRSHRLQVLRTVDFNFISQIGNSVIPAWEVGTTTSGQLPPCDPQLRDKILFTYTLNGTQVVTIDEYRAYFNLRMVRPMPKDIQDLRIGASDMIIEQVDDRDARSAGITNEPKFCEDEKGYCGFQVLDLFEKEVLSAGITVSENDILNYYLDHPADFTICPFVKGTFYSFSSLEDAAKWKGSGGNRIVAEHEEPTSFSTRSLRDDIKFVSQELLRLPVRAMSEPFIRNGVATVFIKTENGPLVVQPLDEVRSTIRAELFAKAIAIREHETAIEARLLLGFEENIDHTRFGIAVPQLAHGEAR